MQKLTKSLLLFLFLLTSVMSHADNKTFALMTSGTIDTSKKYLIVYQSSATATTGILMNSSFTSGATSYAQCAEAGETATISNKQIKIDATNAFTFESTGTDGSYYIKNNAGYYFGNFYTSSSDKTGNWFGATNTSSPGSKYYNTIAFSNSTVQITGSYNNMVLGYTTSAGGTSNVSCFHYMSTSSSVYLYEEIVSSNYTVTISSITGGTVTASPTTAASGATITLSNTPNSGYTFSKYTVTDASGNSVTVNSDGTFTMPASNVTVSAEFTATSTDNSDAGSSVSKDGYTLVFSSETSAIASKYLTSLTDAEKANCTGSFTDQTTLENYWTYSPKGGSVWCSRMGTDISEQRQMLGYSNGTLNLKAGQVTSAYDNTSKFLTSGINTSKNYKYGIIEVKAKCNAHTSNFPAIWIMPEDHANDDEYDVPWPACGECDIMEQIGTSSTAYGTVHTGIRYNTFGKSYKTSDNESVTDAKYHIYTLLWDESSLTWFIDGTQLWQYSKDTSLSEELQYQQFPYNKPYRIILNQAVGKNSSWGSEDPDVSYTYEMDVAYVRVFQKTAGYTDPTCSFQTVEVGKTYQIAASTGQVLAAASTSSGATVSGATASSTDALQQWTVKGSAASGYYFHLNNTSYCMQNSTSSVTTAAEEWSTNQCADGAQEAQTFYYTSDNKLYTLLDNNSSTKYYLVLSSTGTLSTTTTASSATTFTFEEPSSTPTTTYTVTCNTAANGSVTANPTSAESGTAITLTITPDTGYQLSTLSVKDASDNDVTVTDGTFTMPASAVTITATFTQAISGNTYTRTDVTTGTWQSFCLPFNIDIDNLQTTFDKIYIPYDGEDLVIYDDLDQDKTLAKSRLAARRAAASTTGTSTVTATSESYTYETGTWTDDEEEETTSTRYSFAYSADGTYNYDFYIADFTESAGVVIPQGMPFFAHVKSQNPEVSTTITLTGYLWDNLGENEDETEAVLTAVQTKTFPVYSDKALETIATGKTFTSVGFLSDGTGFTANGNIYAINATDGTMSVITQKEMLPYHAYLMATSAQSIILNPIAVDQLDDMTTITDYDLNGDGLTNIVDAAYLISVLNGAEDTRGNADLNLDGTIDQTDLNLLLNRILQK